MQETSELKSHSSALTNERINALNAMFDSHLMNANNCNKFLPLKEAHTAVHVIWLNTRTLARNFSDARMHLDLDTSIEGVYKIDIYDKLIKDMIFKIECNPKLWTLKNRKTILDTIELMILFIRDLLQFFKFMFRTNNLQKPDIFTAVENNIIPDELTLNQLASVIGKSNKIDFDKFNAQLNGNKLIGKKSEDDDDFDYAEDEDIEEDNSLNYNEG
jgi:hypothetical protein